MSLKRCIGACLLLLAGLPLFSMEGGTLKGATGLRDAVVEWRYKAGDEISYASADYDDTAWEAVSLPFVFPLENGSCWLRADIEGPAGDTDAPLYLLLGRLEAAAEIFLNGRRVGLRGAFAPDYSIPANESGSFMLPQGLWVSGGRNVLALRIAAPASLVEVSGIELGDAAAAVYEKRVISFFNFHLYTVLAALCAFIGVYFLALWAGRSKETPNLWYALSSWAIAFYFMEMGSTFPLLGYSLNRALAKACLTVSMAGLVAFFIDYFRLKLPRVLIALLAAIPAAALIAYVLSRGDTVLVDRVFSWNLLFVQAAIVFIVIVTVRAVVRGNREAVPLLVGVVIGVGFGTHDVVYSAMGLKPFAWLQGIGFFSMNLSLFVTLTLRSKRLYTELERYSKDIEEKTQQLSTYLSRIEETANSVSAISAEIDTGAGAAASSTAKLAAEAERIGANAEKQAKAATDSEEAVKSLGDSLGLVRAGVDTQAAGVEESADSVAIVADAVAEVSENVDSTADFVRGLDGTAEKGRQASRVLNEAIVKIKDTAGEVSSIVDAVEDFAERTNLLSMNAAIEAAHAGAAGRGFAVIAGEIKSLAAASAERTERIRDSISDINRRIENSVEANLGVAGALDSVADGAKIALNSIVAVGSSLNNQRSATDRLRVSLQSLASSAASIRGEAERQEADGQRIRSRMMELVSISKELHSSIDGIAQENAAIAQTMKRLAEVSREGRESVSGLRMLLESRQRAGRGDSAVRISGTGARGV